MSPRAARAWPPLAWGSARRTGRVRRSVCPAQDPLSGADAEALASVARTQAKPMQARASPWCFFRVFVLIRSEAPELGFRWGRAPYQRPGSKASSSPLPWLISRISEIQQSRGWLPAVWLATGERRLELQICHENCENWRRTMWRSGRHPGMRKG